MSNTYIILSEQKYESIPSNWSVTLMRIIESNENRRFVDAHLDIYILSSS